MQERFYSTHVRRPKTYFFKNDNYHFTMAVCSWGRPEDCKKFYDLTIENYNLMFNDDATSPFEQYLHLTNIQNKLRIAILMANEQIYREDNRNGYQTGLEFFAMVQNPGIVHWVAVGQPSVFYLNQGQIHTIYSSTATTASSDPIFLYGIGLEPKVHLQTGVFIKPKSISYCFVSRDNIAPAFFKYRSFNISELATELIEQDPTRPFWIHISNENEI